ncbi:MAG TPA: S41 family peptidase [Thermoanaerobaculia bacterium]|nr:S41 family peptidase [Thermoanaerobaculia bacterium]
MAIPRFRIPLFIFLLSTLLAATLGGGWFGGRLLASSDDSGRVGDRMREYAEVLQALEEWAPADIGSDDLVYGSIRGLMESLDPHSHFFAPSDYGNVRDKHAGSYYGVGLLVTQRENAVVVVTPMEGGPAGRLGVRPGDVIVEVDGQSTETLAYDRVTELLRGERGTRVEMRVHRLGFADPISFSIVREAITTKAVAAAFILEPGVGYIRVTDFTNTTEREFDLALAELGRQGMNRLVLDLRGNGGGVLGAAIAIADRFLEKDQMIVFTRGMTAESNEAYVAPGRKPRLALPLVVLVDRGSASASEIVAGAIQDHDRGLVVGETTWGKGLVQSVYNLRHGAGIALTTARYYTPSGRNIQRDYSSLWDYYAHDEGVIAEQLAASPQKFRTATGRSVAGGGGIRPDVEVVRGDRPQLIQLLEARGLAFDFAVSWNAGHPDDGTEVTPEMVAELERLALERRIARDAIIAAGFSDEMVRRHIERMIAAELVAVREGFDASYPWRVQGDEQIMEAVRRLPEAERLARSAAAKRGEDVAATREPATRVGG